MSITLRLVAAPLLFVSVLQLSGCINRTGQIPPGGTYISQSAGAHFEQSVQLADNSREHIAGFPLKKAYRPSFNHELVYIAAGDRGIVISDNSGQSWHILPTPLAQVMDVALLQSGVLVATGLDSDGQGFIIRSLDNGASWEIVLTVPVPVREQRFQVIKEESINSVVLTLAVDPFHPDRLYAGSNLGTLLLGEQSGKTWRTLHTVASTRFDPTGTRQNLGIKSIIPSPYEPTELLFITFDQRLYRWSSGTQSELNVPLYISMAPPFGAGGTQTRKVLNANYVLGLPGVLLAATREGIVVSRDNGGTWEELTVPVETVPTQGFNNAIVLTSPTNPSRLFVAVNSVLYRSEDNGHSWNTFDFRLPSHVITEVLINPTNPASALVVTSSIRT